MRVYARKSALIAIIAAGFFMPASYAAANSGQSKAPNAQHEDPMIQQMDTNHDGKISKKEYNTTLDKRFDALDVNGDGYLENSELRAAREKARQVEKSSGNKQPKP